MNSNAVEQLELYYGRFKEKLKRVTPERLLSTPGYEHYLFYQGEETVHIMNFPYHLMVTIDGMTSLTFFNKSEEDFMQLIQKNYEDSLDVAFPKLPYEYLEFSILESPYRYEHLLPWWNAQNFKKLISERLKTIPSSGRKASAVSSLLSIDNSVVSDSIIQACKYLKDFQDVIGDDISLVDSFVPNSTVVDALWYVYHLKDYEHIEWVP